MEERLEDECCRIAVSEVWSCLEMARMVLPQSTMTEWYWSGSLDAFADMCRLRCKEDTQYESRLVADQVSTIMQDLYPVSWSALMEETE
jgi:thymidylate synthase (FAD)